MDPTAPDRGALGSDSRPAAASMPDEAAKAFAEHVLPELDVLYRVAFSLTRQHADAQDLVQDTLLRAYRAIGRFDGRHPRAWLLTILRNANLNRQRRPRPDLPDRTIVGAARAGRAKAPARRRALPLARTVLAVLLLAMAAGQLSDVGGFVRILGTYQVLPTGLLTPAAWTVAGMEAVAGVLLFSNRRSGASWALAVALVWTALGIQAFARGLALDNCGCFGVHLGQRLRWWVLVEDAEFVALAAFVQARFHGRPSGRERRGAKHG